MRAGAFPISIDSAELDELAAAPEVLERAQQLRSDLGDPHKIILGVDRLDYTKGIDVRLRAFGELLAEDADRREHGHGADRDAEPGAGRALHPDARRHRAAVGRINGAYSRVGQPAVHYLHQSLPREELAAFYAAADVMLVTPLRDGMNLVAKEYVACRLDDGGVLVLSEFTGAANELRDALLVNPHDTDGVKDALRPALTMDPAEARRRMRALRRQVLTHDVDRWARRFLDALGPALGERRRRMTADSTTALRALAARPPAAGRHGLRRRARADRRRPGDARPLPAAVTAMRALAAIPGTTVAVISGRGLADLAAVAGSAPPCTWSAATAASSTTATAPARCSTTRRRARGWTGCTAELRSWSPASPG